jgi:hypothetical protein
MLGRTNQKLKTKINVACKDVGKYAKYTGWFFLRIIAQSKELISGPPELAQHFRL